LSLILACAALLGWAGLRANAAWHYLAAESITSAMYDTRRFAPAGIDAADAQLQRALARFPRHPDFLHLAGILKQLRAAQPGVLGAEQREWLALAAQDYRAALVTRPLWPYSWVNLLSVKDKLGEVDAEYIAALHRAAETGPWEPYVQLELIRSGVRWWDRLRQPERALVRAKAADALRVQPREVFEIARFYARPDLVCGHNSGQPQIESWCLNVL